MNEEQSYFVEYLKEYIKLLTGDREEFFLSLCDVEEELLKDLDVSSMTGYQVVKVDNRDYSKAVRLRNDVKVKRIVLLSGEGVKQIDSLKDFNEYSVLSRDRKLIWQCLEAIFHVRLEKEVKVFLEAILAQSEISLWELLKYLYESGMSRGRILPRRLNRNLPMLGIWKSNSTKILTKGKVKRMIRLSKYSIIENRLNKAIMDNKINDPKTEKMITNSLAQGSVQKILGEMYFEEKVEKLLKNPPKNIRGEEDAGGSAEEAASENSDWFSYEYLLRECPWDSVENVEKQWLEEKQAEQRSEKQDEEGSGEPDWNRYRPLADSIGEFQAPFKQLYAKMQNLNITQDKIGEMTALLEALQKEFEDAWEAVTEATPACLNTFCEAAKGYTQKYLELLAYLMTEEKVRYAMAKEDIIPMLQTLFCKVDEEKVQMPFYHPVCVSYYMGIREMYRYVVGQAADVDLAQQYVLEALVNKLGMQFPIDFMEAEGCKYALDYTTVWKSDEQSDVKSGTVVFRNIEEGVVYSVLDFRIIQKQILDYIEKHRFLTEINIALVDISALGGLLQLIDRIRQISDGEYCNIGRVTFLILSAKEEELKNELSQMWDLIGTDNIVRFRFGRGSYCGRDREGNLQYDLEQIVREADMTVIADGSVLYHTPRMVAQQGSGNMIRNRLEKISLTQQTDRYFKQGKSDIPVLWDTLQHIAGSREDGLWRWKSKEINNGILTFINQTVSQDSDKTIVALSSNEHILSEIFKTGYMQAHRRKYNGKSITIISFAGGNRIHQLPLEGSVKIVYSLKDFYNTALEIEHLPREILPEAVDIYLEFDYEEQFRCQCRVYEEDAEEKEREAESGKKTGTDWKTDCGNFIKWQMGSFLEEDNILCDYFRELLLNQWYEGTKSVPAVLMVEKLCKGNQIALSYEKKDSESLKEEKGEPDKDCMEAVKIHELIQFAGGREVIDEYTLGQFRERFETDMPERILDCDREQNLLEEREQKRLFEIRERIKGK